MKHVTYLIYIIFWEVFTLGGGAYVVFGLHENPWWMLLALILSASACGPLKWIHGIQDADSTDED